ICKKRPPEREHANCPHWRLFVELKKHCAISTIARSYVIMSSRISCGFGAGAIRRQEACGASPCAGFPAFNAGWPGMQASPRGGLGSSVQDCRRKGQSMEMYKYETHAHTAEVSRCATIPAKELVRFYKSMGYAGICI